MPSKMSKKDKVVIIIVSYNGQEYWSSLMPPLVQEKYRDFDVEVLLVDNNSSDGSADYVEKNYPEVKVIRNSSNTGFVGANNSGYDYAKEMGADYIYLLNQDTVVTPGFLEPLYKFAKANPTAGSLQSKLLLWSDKERINTLGNAIHFLGFGYGTKANKIDDHRSKTKKINYCSGAGVFVSMKALDDLGHLFDETMFMYLEDMDLGWSLSMLGYDNYIVPESVVYHKYEFSRGMRQYRWFERNRLWLTLKNYKLGTLILFFPAWLVMEFGQLLFAIKNRTLVEKIKSYSFLLSAKEIKTLMAYRKDIQSRRKRSDRQVTRKFTGLILFQPLESFPLKIANIFFFVYWQVTKWFIFW